MVEAETKVMNMNLKEKINYDGSEGQFNARRSKHQLSLIDRGDFFQNDHVSLLKISCEPKA